MNATADRDLAALLAAVKADPADDLARLAYADRLEELGEAKHAEFVRVQMDVAAGGRKYTPTDLLLDFAPKVPAGIAECRWADRRRHRPAAGATVFVTRGFVADVACPLAWWRQWGPTLAATQPVERVHLTDWAPKGEWADLPPHDLRYFWSNSDEDFTPFRQVMIEAVAVGQEQRYAVFMARRSFITSHEPGPPPHPDEPALLAMSAALLAWADRSWQDAPDE